MQILAISGSLRRSSLNTALLRATTLLTPSGVHVVLYRNLGELPHFNPDLEDNEPPVVSDFRAQIRASAGLLISSPEYAHGIPGVLKNAFDWLVGGHEFIGKPVAIFNASPRSTYAQASLTEVITVMSGRIVTDASITLPLLDKHLDEHGIAANPEFANAVRLAITAFVRAIERMRE